MMIFLTFLVAPGRAADFSEKVVVTIQKPEIQILISKRNLTPKYDLTLRESFLPQIIEAAQKKPF